MLRRKKPEALRTKRAGLLRKKPEEGVSVRLIREKPEPVRSEVAVARLLRKNREALKILIYFFFPFHPSEVLSQKRWHPWFALRRKY